MYTHCNPQSAQTSKTAPFVSDPGVMFTHIYHMTITPCYIAIIFVIFRTWVFKFGEISSFFLLVWLILLGIQAQPE